MRHGKYRMLDWVATALLLFVVIAILAPQQVPVTLYKLSLITSAAVLGYWLDRSLFPYGRPDEFKQAAHFGNHGSDLIFAACMLRRSLIIGACVLAVALGA